MFYYLYEIKNLVNGKIYVGVHKTKSLDDGYMGSGKVINAAIRKYGIENFTKVILEQFDNSTAMYAREKEVVTDEFLLREDVYNLRRGGFGGFDHINKIGINNKDHEKSLHKCIAALARARTIARSMGPAFNEKLRQSKLNGASPFNDKKITRKGNIAAKSPTAILKRKKTFEQINHQQGEKNSQFGKMWITNEIESVKIKKQDPIPCGWRKGRSTIF